MLKVLLKDKTDYHGPWLYFDHLMLLQWNLSCKTTLLAIKIWSLQGMWSLVDRINWN